jgi:hypothetical protein
VAFTELNWRKEAPDIVERAIALCAGLGDVEISEYSCRLRDLESEFEYRHDLAVVVREEIYKRRTPCWIYFARVGDNLLKIGRSTRVAGRINDLSKQHRIEHVLLGTVRGDYREEWRMHNRCRKHRLKNLEGGLREYYEYEPIAEVVNDCLVAGAILRPSSGRWMP